MESTRISLAEKKSDGDCEKEAVKAGQDATAEEKVEVVNGEMKQLASQVNQVICGGRAGALGILPEELWLKILEEYVDSAEDIRNVLLAFPQLDKLFQKKKASWLFPLVLPHLVTKHLIAVVNNNGSTSMRSQELLKLRLVSKRWKAAVERSLENHNERCPLLPRENPEPGPNAVAIPDNHFNYHRIREYHLGTSRFKDAETIDAFLEEMKGFQGNPFPGKSVRLRMADHTNVGQALTRFVVLLEMFGQHVVDLTINHWRNFEQDHGNLELYRNVLRCLTLVPNLRSLTFSGCLFEANDAERDNFFGHPGNQNLFPELRNLERFEFHVVFVNESIWMTRMLETYGRKEGLRKLVFPLKLLSIVDLAFSQSVHLTELHLILEYDFDENFDGIVRVVNGLPNHQEMRKFSLSSSVPWGTIRINELIRMLAECKFESVVLEDIELVEDLKPISTPEALLPAVTVTSLDLEETGELGLSYDFLRELPNLKFLSVRIESRRLSQILKEYRKMKRDGLGDLEVGSLGKRLTRYVMKAYDPTLEIPENAGIWEGIPSLEMLSLSMPVDSEEGDVKYLGVRFVRECGNKAFFGPMPNVVRWHEEREVQVEVQVSEMESDLMVKALLENQYS